jgi:hypothetical protein
MDVLALRDQQFQNLLIVVRLDRIVYIVAEQRKVADSPARLATEAICAHSALINGCHSNWKQQAAPPGTLST